MAAEQRNGLLANWKSLAACSLISMSSFQYGVDYTMIGGFQAMVGFLKVSDKKQPMDYQGVATDEGAVCYRFSDIKTRPAPLDGTLHPNDSN